MRRLVLMIGLAQAVGMLVFAVSIVVTASTLPSTLGAPEIEALIYSIFGLSVGALAYGIYRQNSWFRTPFILIQVFIGIVSTTLIQGASLQTHLVGVVMMLSAIAASIFAVKALAAST